MTRSRTAELARGLTAALAIAALVVLPPILLTRFIGWPLPHNPNLDDITHSIRGTPISDQVLLKALAIAGWVAWVNAIACLIAEVIAWRRQRTAALPDTQVAADWVVGARCDYASPTSPEVAR